MKCPYCDFQGRWRPLQAHLADSHPEQVQARLDEDRGRMSYSITCPYCGSTYEHPVKPRGDPGFLQEFAREIRLVAFDMFVAHLAAEHDTTDQEGSGGGGPEVPHP